MGMSKSVKFILSLVLVVFLALAATKTEASKFIDYGDLKRGDHSRNCDRARPESCQKEQVNPYRRGCEKSQRCRSD
ncbi:hypothetical protein CARUB_v10022412mg [Capsella rubella]|uniref:Uncharacterized protein n=1 Tax=Capsella rubella TaxID=81985 RepID=R0I9N4_9BRAS|nr:protein RALF-like 9 [Capsella rubella]EOA34830.1 hypothetical protein CARUB_v10022412mg [Capsella rubella]